MSLHDALPVSTRRRNAENALSPGRRGRRASLKSIFRPARRSATQAGLRFELSKILEDHLEQHGGGRLDVRIASEGTAEDRTECKTFVGVDNTQCVTQRSAFRDVPEGRYVDRPVVGDLRGESGEQLLAFGEAAGPGGAFDEQVVAKIGRAHV